MPIIYKTPIPHRRFLCSADSVEIFEFFQWFFPNSGCWHPVLLTAFLWLADRSHNLLMRIKTYRRGANSLEANSRNNSGASLEKCCNSNIVVKEDEIVPRRKQFVSNVLGPNVILKNQIVWRNFRRNLTSVFYFCPLFLCTRMMLDKNLFL